MTMHGTDLVLMLLLVVAGCAGCYLLLVRKLEQIVTERDLKIADQLGALDAAIQAVETRLAEHRAAGAAENQAAPAALRNDEAQSGSGSIAGDIKAVVAAAAGAVLRKNIAIKSIRAIPTPWSQQGRVIVLGSHNLRARQ
jgi:hypothetical protein